MVIFSIIISNTTSPPREDQQKQKKHKQAVNQRIKKLKECINKHRPLSWSAISSFEYSKDDFYSKYVLGEKTDPNSKMLFGNEVGGRLATEPNFLPEIPRYEIYEQKLAGKIDDIHLIGYLDNFCPETKNFHEFKTSSSKTRWTQEKAQEHGQIMFYKFLIYQNYGIDPSTIKCNLFYIPVEEAGDFSMKLSNEPIQCFEVIHSVTDIIKFGNYIKKIWQKMQDFVEKKELAL